jgi:hypothetical protein
MAQKNAGKNAQKVTKNTTKSFKIPLNGIKKKAQKYHKMA